MYVETAGQSSTIKTVWFPVLAVKVVTLVVTAHSKMVMTTIQKSLTLCNENVWYMKEVVGYNCKALSPFDQENRQKELEAGLKRLYEKYKVKA